MGTTDTLLLHFTAWGRAEDVWAHHDDITKSSVASASHLSSSVPHDGIFAINGSVFSTSAQFYAVLVVRGAPGSP